MNTRTSDTRHWFIVIAVLSLFIQGCAGQKPLSPAIAQYNDAHFHIANYAMQGVPLKTLIDDYMGDRVSRSTAMPIPLQQKWDPYEHYADDEMPPNYYLVPKAALYYYSFIDAQLALDYLKLSDEDKTRIDPMITGFDPMDNYAVDHIKRVLLNFPSVFSGIGEFTVHKEVVSNKIAGDTIQAISRDPLPPDATYGGKLSLYSPALAKVLDFAGEAGLVVILHSDLYPTKIDYDGKPIGIHPTGSYLEGMKHLCTASPEAKLVWAHTGLGRLVTPPAGHLDSVAQILDTCPNWSVDISWDLVQAYIVSPQPGMPSIEQWLSFVRRYPDRVLWGSDTVIHTKNKLDNNGQPVIGDNMSVKEYVAVLDITSPLWQGLGPEISYKVKIGNHIRLFNAARARVRNWEKTHANEDIWNLKD